MKTTFKVYNCPEKGLVHHTPGRYKAFLEETKGETLIIEMEVHDPKASYNMHAYYRIINRWLRKETNTFGGWDEDDISEWAIGQCGTTVKTNYLDGQPVTIKSRINLRTVSEKKMGEFLENWKRYLYEKHQIIVPPPKSLI